MNAEIQPLANLRNASDRICVVLEREELRSMMDKNILEGSIRSYLRAGIDGK